MKSFDSRVYSINDFVEWSKNEQLELNPFFQRRPVWSEKAKSYLMDTIVRGKPIPKIFIRQKINVSTKSSFREVVDGQQRLKAIIDFAEDRLVLSKRAQEFRGLKYSTLSEDQKGEFLEYAIAVDSLVNASTDDVLEVFARLNSYTVSLLTCSPLSEQVRV